MRRALRWLLWTLAALIVLPLAVLAIVVAALNTDPGRGLAERVAAQATGGQVTLSGLGGRFPDRLRIGRIEVRDARGVWLTVENAALDWSPTRLLARDAAISRLTAGVVAVARLPVSSPAAPASSRGGSGLPVRVDVDTLHIDRIALAAPVAGVAAALTADGSAHLASLQAGAADIALHRVDGAGSYHVIGRLDARGLSATLAVEEPVHGLISEVARLPELGALAVQASIDGPWRGAVTRVSVSAGPLRAEANGRVNIDGQVADLDVTASAPAMAPRTDVAWQAVALDAHVHGPFARPRATANLQIDGLSAAGAGVGRLTAKIDGDQRQMALTASADGVRLPGPQPDLLAAAPVTLSAQVQLDAPDRPVTFKLAHPLLALNGAAQTGGAIKGRAHLDLPDLAPLAGAGGADLEGRAALDLTAAIMGDTTTVTLDGTLGVTGGLNPVPGLLGPDAKVGATAALRGADVTVSRLQVDGRTLTFAAHGGMTGGNVDLDWTLALADLSVLAATVQGAAQARGHVQGPLDTLAAQADMTGEVATAGLPRGPVTVSLSAAGLPNAPTGQVTAEGTLDGAPLSLAAVVARQADGVTTLKIDRADWKSAHAEGALSLAPQAALPDGRLALRMDRLDDLRRLLGQPVGGSVNASFAMADDNGRKRATIQVEARDAGLAGTARVGRAVLNAKLFDPATDPDLDATLEVTGLQASGLGGSARVTARGKQAALTLGLEAALQGVAGSDLTAKGAAQLDVPDKRVSVSALEAVWKGETLRLLQPMRVAFGDGVSVDRARLGLRAAVLEVAGRVSPTLDVTASLRNVTADLARIVAPDIEAEGALQADAKLTGTPRRPSGTIRLSASGLRMRHGPAAGLPPASLSAAAVLAGATAHIQARVAEGRNEVTLTGTAPIDPAAAMDVRLRGQIDLAVLDPLLAAEGRRVRGRMALDASVTGTLAAPRAGGTLRLTGGEVQDFAQGARLSSIEALIEGDGDTVRLSRFNARAGGGTMAASGSLGLAGAMPVALHVTAKDAAPLTTDKLTATLDMDIALRGEVQGQLAVAGDVTINRADIRIPDKLPAKVAVLDVRTPGAPPPPPPSAAPRIALDVRLTAPGQVFVRGRGLFAELQGRIRVGGTAAAPLPVGRFQLRRGEFNLAGRALTFTTGEVGFDGSGKLDPTLNFVATSTNGSIVATLTITGYASAPKIALSSIPELPQDEVLAQLLFHQSASTLSAFQLAEAAAALAQVSGATGGFDPLNSLRQGLGLDRLSVGGSQGGTGATLEAGRYVAQGVYVGAKQGTSGTGTQATVQIDLLKGLKLETDVGTGSTTSATGSSATTDPSGTSVGLTYHFDY